MPPYGNVGAYDVLFAEMAEPEIETPLMFKEGGPGASAVGLSRDEIVRAQRPGPALRFNGDTNSDIESDTRGCDQDHVSDSRLTLTDILPVRAETPTHRAASDLGGCRVRQVGDNDT